jgi:RHS repeat-associated protein
VYKWIRDFYTLISVNDIFDVKIYADGREETTTYYKANNELIAKKEIKNGIGTITYHHNDHLGSASMVTSTNGVKVEETKYLPYGEVRSGGNENLTGRYTYTGQESDGETGLMYYGARYYSAEIGRFVQPDSMLPDIYDPQEINRYGYVKNNPLKYTDPTGNCATGIVVDTGACGVVVVVSGTAYTVALVGVTTITIGGIAYGVSCVINCDATNENIGKAIIRVEQLNNKVNAIAKVAYYQAQNAVSNSAESVKKALLGLVALVMVGQSDNNQEETPRPKEKGNKSKLPNKGSHKYRAPKEKGVNQDTAVKKANGQNGYVDEKGNIWKWDEKGKHWDVQHKNGTYTNVKPNGEIHHGKNNF